MGSHAEEATAWLSDKQRAMEAALASLVDVNSYTDNPEGGRQVGALLRDVMAIPGIEATTRQFLGNRGRFPGWAFSLVRG